MEKRTTNCLIAGLIFLSSCLEKEVSLVGTWKFISDQQIDSLGNIVNRDNHVDGLLTYTKNGDMSVQLIWFTKRELVMSDTVMNFDGISSGVGLGTNLWTEEQNRTWIDTYDAYFGEYEIDGSSQIVTHRISGNLRPERRHKEYKRHFKLKGDTLFLSSIDPREKWQTLWTRK